MPDDIVPDPFELELSELFRKATSDGRPLSPALVASVLKSADLSIVQLRQVGWVGNDTHELLELDTDEDYVPPDSSPLWVASPTRSWNLPETDFLDG